MASIFTKIINHEIPAHIIYEDEATIAFLDINPTQKGHTLVVPKEPFMNVFDGSPEAMGNLMAVATTLAPAIVNAVGAAGANLIMNNGEAAGQEVMHAHLHIIPRFIDDGAITISHSEDYHENEAAALATQISATLED